MLNQTLSSETLILQPHTGQEVFVWLVQTHSTTVLRISKDSAAAAAALMTRTQQGDQPRA